MAFEGKRTPLLTGAEYTLGVPPILGEPVLYCANNPPVGAHVPSKQQPLETCQPSKQDAGQPSAMMAFFYSTLESSYMRNILGQDQVTKDVK